MEQAIIQKVIGELMQTTTFQAISLHIPLIRVFPNPEQPRKHFDQEFINELAESIKEHGVIEPVIVEQAGTDYILHDGEQRTMAARIAGLTDIPAIVHPPLNGTGPRVRLVKAVVANVQRAQMSPLDEAQAYKRLRDEFDMSIATISRQTGKGASHIGQRLLLTELDSEIQNLISQGLLPHTLDAVKAMLSLPADVRVKFCSALATRKPSVQILIAACQKLLAQTQERAARQEKSESHEPLKSPAVQIATKHAELKLPAWDIWQQLGALPQWSIVREAGTATCDACAIRPAASFANCKDCPAVECIRRMMQASHAQPNKPRHK